jgi:hypothetical protein
MDCRDALDLITAAVFGRLSPSQRQELEAHLAACAECSRRYRKILPLMHLQPDVEHDEIPDPDLERSWEIIAERSLRRDPGWRSRLLFSRYRTPPVPKWVLAAASLLVVFVLGYFAGRSLLSPGSGPGRDNLTALRAGTSFASLEDYAESLQPVLINFLNRDGVDTPAEIRALEHRLIGDILVRTRLLKSLAASNDETELMELLQDLEFILISMENLRPEDRDSARHLARLIRESHVPLRLQEFIRAYSVI